MLTNHIFVVYNIRCIGVGCRRSHHGVLRGSPKDELVPCAPSSARRNGADRTKPPSAREVARRRLSTPLWENDISAVTKGVHAPNDTLSCTI